MTKTREARAMETENKWMNDVGREEEEYQVDLMELFYRLVEKIRYIVAAAVAGAVIMALVTMLFITPKYVATSKLYVMSAGSSAINLSDLQIGNYLASDYKEVFNNWHVHEKVIQNLNLDYTYEELGDMIEISNPSDTRILYISVTSADPVEAQTLANEYAKVAREFITEKMETREPSMFEEALLPYEPDSPSLTKNTFIGLFLGLVASCGFFVVQFLLDDRIRTSDDIERLTGLITLGMMPIQSAERARKEKQEIRKQLAADAKAEKERSKKA